jgi:hypothetical protein
VLLALLVLLGLQAQLVHKDRLVLPDLQVHQVPQVRLVLQDLLVPQVQLDQQDQPQFFMYQHLTALLVL